MKEANELYKIAKELAEIFIWKDIGVKESWYLKKSLWQLKAKIDSYKTQIIDACAEVDKLTRIINKLHDAMQPPKLTEEEKERILSDYWEKE